MKHLKDFNSYNEGLASGFGKLLSSIEKNAKSVLGRIGRTGNDEDLAKEVLDYVDYLYTTWDPKSRSFKPTIPLSGVARTIYNRNQKLMSPYEIIHKVGDANNYVVFGHIFKNDPETKWRVDVIKVLDKEFEKVPYRIVISKIRKQKVEFRGLGPNSPQPRQLSTPNPTGDEKPVMLDCSYQIAREIFNRTATIWELTNKNTKGDARGGMNTNQRQAGTTGLKLPGDDRENKDKRRLTFTYR